MKKEITVFSPATVANVACGFDIFGFALETPGDEITVRLTSKPGVSLISVSGGILPLDPEKNTAGVSVIELLKFLGSAQGIEIELKKKMPLGSGLGSSAASSVGSVFAANLLLGSPLTPKELIPFAMEAEYIASGSRHADNVAPALLGGFILIRSYNPLDIVQIPLNIDLYCTILHPHMEIQTAMARKILKQEVSLNQLVTQTGNAAGLIAGLIQGDASLISRCLEDVVVEPIRARLIPDFQEIKEAALKAGALGCSISGSGPSLFALTTNKPDAEKVGLAMKKASKLTSDLFMSPINKAGPRLL